ncbi:MAG: thioredoxin domain-containing protein, partial [Verrucomicrobiota bacterium]
ADNPVDWWPWCDEAFEEAKRRDVPLLISIGYSACHWCHVMAHESFESDYIAGLMNRYLVCVKVDREERPDVDHIYMEAVQMMNQNGGWPLNVFCLPDGRPFYGGTYFPPDEKRGMQVMPWPQLVMRISEFYKKERAECESNAESIVKNLEHLSDAYVRQAKQWDPRLLFEAADHINERHDDEYGGFGGAPKFPPSMTLDFLLAVRNTRTCAQDPELVERIDKVVNTTLHGMAHGGIFDQFGGGFCRYSVDKFWLIPHFEKMAYDNGLLLDVYAKAFHQYQDAMYPLIMEETIGWLVREMASDEGGFFSAIDADSGGEEGVFYCWNQEQILEVLGDELGSEVCDAYLITEKGTFEGGLSNPALSTSDLNRRQSLYDARMQLLAKRESREKPGIDRKRLTAWNALLMRGIAEAGFSLGRSDWVGLAEATGEWLWAEMIETAGDVFPVAYPEGPIGVGTLNDYAFTAEAFLALASRVELFAQGSAERWVDRAKVIVDRAIEKFLDTQKPGFFLTASDQNDLIVRKKDWHDNAIPSANAGMMHALSSLASITGDGCYREIYQEMVDLYPALISNVSSAASHGMAAIVRDLTGVAVIRVNGVEHLYPDLIEGLSAKPWRRVFILPADDPDQADGFQLCVGQHCTVPTMQIDRLFEELVG